MRVPRTTAGRALLNLVREDGSVFLYEVAPAILAIEAEASVNTFAVIYSNYYPRETYGIFTTEALAEAVADGLNEVDGSGMWNVERRVIQTEMPTDLVERLARSRDSSKAGDPAASA